MKRQTPRGTAVIWSALLASLVLALGACGSSESSDAGSSADSRAASQPEALTDQAAPESEMGADQDTKQAPAVTKQAIISTGAVALESKDVAKARTQVQHITDKHSGQVTEQETGTDEDGKPGHARMVLRIPSASFDEAMAEIEKLGTLVDSSTTATDVTTEVIDTDVRVKNARTSIERIRTLLTQAEKIGDVISIESELASREAELNSLLAQQAHLADQTSLSTITVSISRDGAAPAKGSDSGFLPGLSAGWDALRALGTWLATGAGVLIPWVPVIALVGVPIWLLVRRRRATSAPAPATGAAAEAADG